LIGSEHRMETQYENLDVATCTPGGITRIDSSVSYSGSKQYSSCNGTGHPGPGRRKRMAIAGQRCWFRNIEQPAVADGYALQFIQRD